MNLDDRRTLSQFLQRLSAAPAGEQRELAFDKLVHFIDALNAGMLSRCVDAGTAVRVDNDTPRALAESLTALLYTARLAAEDLGRRLPTEGGRDAAKEIERTLGNGSPGVFDGLYVDDAKLECCSGPIADIDESLKPHIDSPRFDEAANHFEAA